MDLTLRCNSLKCRAQLADRAVVTTCSHIFCEQCSRNLGLTNAAEGVRICPACETQLTNPDDAVLTALNPAEDYKTSILSGLSPSVIIECASRGVAFFQYQMAQEITYQDFMAKSLADKYGNLSSQMDSVINDANAEIMGLRDKLAASLAERKALENKNCELAEAYKEKSRAQQRLQSMYQKLKGRVNAVQVEDAAAHDVENVIYAAATGHRNGSAGSHEGLQRPRAAYVRGDEMPGSFADHRVPGLGQSRQAYGWEGQGTRGPIRSPTIQEMPQSSQRERLAIPTYRNENAYSNHGQDFAQHGNYGPPAPTPARQRLSSIDANVMQSRPIQGYGMSAGMKVGRQNAGPVHQPTPSVKRMNAGSMLGMR